MSFIQYLKDTRGELHHVAWPTRVQTVVFTILVIMISILISLYLGFFDFLFTTGLGKVIEMLPSAASSIQAEEPQIDFTPVGSPAETPKN
jgi:preprotein translocase SecE subunit